MSLESYLSYLQSPLFEIALKTRAHKMFPSLSAASGYILTFHRVTPEASEGFRKDLELQATFLEKLILHFKNQAYEFWSLNDLHDSLKKGLGDKKFICLSFDDGYRDTLSVAYPILKRHSIPFAVYVSTGFIENRGGIHESQILERILDSNEELHFEWEGRRLHFDLHTKMKKSHAFQTLKKITLPLDHSRRTAFYESVSASGNSAPQDSLKHPPMSWEELKQLARDPLVTVGAHSVEHRALALLPASEATFEIQKSRELLESQLGIPVQHFCYPYGRRQDAGPRDFEIVKNLGFKTATTSRFGGIHAQHVQSLENLPRIPISGFLEKAEHLDVLTSALTATLMRGLGYQ